VTGVTATLATKSIKSVNLSRQNSEDMPKRPSLSTVSNDTAGSKVQVWTSEGLQESGSSAGRLMESVSTPVSSEYQSTRNLTVLDGGPSSLWLATRLSESSIGSEMLRVSEPSSTSFKDLAGAIENTASAADVTGGNEEFPRVVESPSDAEKRDDKDEAMSLSMSPAVTEIKKTDQPGYDEDGHKQKDSAAEKASCVQVTEEESGIKHRETPAELTLESLNDGDVVTVQNAEDVESRTPTDIIAERMTDYPKLERSKTFRISETAVLQIPDPPEPVTRSDSYEDLPARQVSVSMVDVLPLNELPSAVEPEDLEPDHEAHGEWPPLPSDEELLISDAELEPSVNDELEEYVESKDTELLHSAAPQPGASLGPESGTLAVGASEKILTKAAHLRDDVDSMHRFKYYTCLSLSFHFEDLSVVLFLFSLHVSFSSMKQSILYHNSYKTCSAAVYSHFQFLHINKGLLVYCF